MTPDLFSFAPPAPPVVSPSPPPVEAMPTPPAAGPPTYPVPLKTGSREWQRVLAELETDDVVFFVSALWTGVVLEVATGQKVGRRGWCRDGSIEEFGSPNGFAPGRQVHLRPAEALELHRRTPLVVTGKPGITSGLLRFAGAADASGDAAAVLERLLRSQTP